MSPTPRSVLELRLRLAAACLLLVGLSVVQEPGLLVPDTKLDLAVAPARFLGRAVHLWDPLGAFGQLQNQAYGYLWPMGPFFWLGSAADLPGWLVQRLWVALVLCVAMTGAAKLARTLGVRSDLACLLAGFAYALSPRMLTTLGPISVEAWPSALAPWVLLPLVVGSVRGSARRAAALSALAVATVGGVNAAATLAVLPLGVVWLLTRTPGPRRRALVLWWPVFTLLGTLWWLVPLFVLGAHSPPFLDYIESAANTTFPTTVYDALRGTSDWVAYVDRTSRAGNDLIRLPYLAVETGVLVFLGLVGLLRRDVPERLFLVLGVLTGLFLVTMGHLGAGQGWPAVGLRGLLDGVLAPLRNVHKFDPVVRLPLVLGLALLVDSQVARWRSGARATGPARLERLNAGAVTGLALLAVLGAAGPATAGRIAPTGALQAVPGYWRQTATWLAHHRGGALLAPGSSFGDYVWGSPRDEPLQSLATSPWAVRNAVPLAPPGNIRMLDAVEQRFSEGLGSPGLAAYLARAGVRHLVVRNDLARSGDVPDPVLVHQALAGSPGLTRVATFGPPVGGAAHLVRHRSRVLVNGGWQTRYPAVEVYRVDVPSAPASTSTQAPVVVGGPEDLLDLADLGVLGDQPTRLAADLPADRPLPGGHPPLVLTDGSRATERTFGRVHDGWSATLAPGDPRRLPNPTRDYLLPHPGRWSTTAHVDGVRSVGASSSMADADVVGPVEPGQSPYAAVDGNPATAWVAAPEAGGPAWWREDFTRPRAVATVRVSAGPDADEVVRVGTDHVRGRTVELGAGETRLVEVGDDRASWLRVQDESGRPAHQLALAEVAVPGVTVDRSLVLPPVPRRWGAPDRIVLRAVQDSRTGCVRVAGATRCVPGRQVASEEPAGFRRRLTVPAGGPYDVRVRARPRPGPALDRLLLRDQPVGISASSTGSPDSRASALAAVDGDPGTTWTAGLADVRPVLRLSWLGRRRVSGLRLVLDPDSDARLPDELVVSWPGGRRRVTVARDGGVSFPPVRTDQLTLRVREADPASSLGFDSAGSPVPVGIGELRVTGLGLLPVAVPQQRVRLGCGSGPTLRLDGRREATAVTASPRRLYDGATVRATPCGPATLRLGPGGHELDALASPVLAPTSVVLSDGRPIDGTPSAATLRSHGPVTRTVRPLTSGGLLTVRQNTNDGWRAVQDGRTRPPVVVDGWQQGWSLGGATGPVHLRYAPDRPYRTGLLLGLVGLLALAGIVVGSRRRHDERPALHPRRLPTPARWVLAVGCGGLLAGWGGAAVALVAAVVAHLLVRRRPGVAPWLLAGLVLPAAAAYALRPWGGSEGWAGQLAWPHYLAVAAVVAVLCSPSEEDRGRLRPGPWLRSRIAGRSTTR